MERSVVAVVVIVFVAVVVIVFVVVVIIFVVFVFVVWDLCCARSLRCCCYGTIENLIYYY